MNRAILMFSVVALAGSMLSSDAHAGGHRRRNCNPQPWNGPYYEAAVGAPLALVVPPTAERQTKYSWGVTGTETQRIYPQYHRRPLGPDMGFAAQPAPYWPGSTDQMGVYYVRGPWKR